MPEVPKLAAAVRSDLSDWQKLNVIGFLISGIGTIDPDLVGKPYVDADGHRYLPMLGIPLLVFTGDQAGLSCCHHNALRLGLEIAVYTDELFRTGNDVDNRAAVARVPTPELSLAGMAVLGERRQVDKAFDHLELHT